MPAPDSRRPPPERMGELVHLLKGNEAVTSSLVQPWRQLLREGELLKAHSKLEVQKVRRVFLFSDILLWCTPEYQIRGRLDLAAAQVLLCDSPLDIEVVHPQRASPLRFTCADEVDRRLWFRDLTDAALGAITLKAESLLSRMQKQRQDAVGGGGGGGGGGAAAASAAAASGSRRDESTASAQEEEEADGGSAYHHGGAAARGSQPAAGVQARQRPMESPRGAARQPDSPSVDELQRGTEPAVPRDGEDEHSAALRVQVEQATEALRNISRSDMTLLKHMTNPQPCVRMVLEAVAILLGAEPVHYIRGRKAGEDDYWKPACALLAKPHFLRLLLGHSETSTRASDRSLEVLYSYVTNPLLAHKLVHRASPAAGVVWRWVRANYARDVGKSLQQIHEEAQRKAEQAEQAASRRFAPHVTRARSTGRGDASDSGHASVSSLSRSSTVGRSGQLPSQISAARAQQQQQEQAQPPAPAPAPAPGASRRSKSAYRDPTVSSAASVSVQQLPSQLLQQQQQRRRATDVTGSAASAAAVATPPVTRYRGGVRIPAESPTPGGPPAPQGPPPAQRPVPQASGARQASKLRSPQVYAEADAQAPEEQPPANPEARRRPESARGQASPQFQPAAPARMLRDDDYEEDYQLNKAMRKMRSVYDLSEDMTTDDDRAFDDEDDSPPPESRRQPVPAHAASLPRSGSRRS